MTVDIKPGTVISLGLLAAAGYAGYKFLKGDWKLPDLGNLFNFNLGDPESLPNTVLNIVTPGIESMPPITDLLKITTGEKGVMYDYKLGRILAIDLNEYYPKKGEEVPGQIVTPAGPGIPAGGPAAPEEPEEILNVDIPEFLPPMTFEPTPQFQQTVPTEKQMTKFKSSVSVQKPIEYVAPKIKEAIVQEVFGGTKLGSIIVEGFK